MDVRLGGQTLSRNSNYKVKCLGVLVDDKLMWLDHIECEHAEVLWGSRKAVEDEGCSGSIDYRRTWQKIEWIQKYGMRLILSQPVTVYTK